jgi:hypothetical protein
LLWCSETKNDFKSNFEIVRKDNKWIR